MRKTLRFSSFKVIYMAETQRVINTKPQDAVLGERSSLITRVAELLEEKDESLVGAALMFAEWREDKLLSMWYGNREKLEIESGARSALCRKKESKQEEKTSCCEICECKGQMKAPRKCGHQYCERCWRDYLRVNLTEKKTINMRCIYPGCGLLMTSEFVAAVGDADLVQRYQRQVICEFVSSKSNWKWCPGKQCQNVVKLDGRRNGTIRCNICQEHWCFFCEGHAHDPVPCTKARIWRHDLEGTCMCVYEAYHVFLIHCIQ